MYAESANQVLIIMPQSVSARGTNKADCVCVCVCVCVSVPAVTAQWLQCDKNSFYRLLAMFYLN